YDSRVPGDPLTPGWASVPGAPRIKAADAISIPKIMSVPLSWRDARTILEALGGPQAPPAWQGGIPPAQSSDLKLRPQRPTLSSDLERSTGSRIERSSISYRMGAGPAIV